MRTFEKLNCHAKIISNAKATFGRKMRIKRVLRSSLPFVGWLISTCAAYYCFLVGPVLTWPKATLYLAMVLACIVYAFVEALRNAVKRRETDEAETSWAAALFVVIVCMAWPLLVLLTPFAWADDWSESSAKLGRQLKLF
jgi:drug/metabolite transporter (DMT)-like permease